MDNTNTVTLVQRLQQHNAWVNRNLLAAAAQLSDEQLREVFPIGQGSVWKSLTHMYAAEYVWLAALEGDDQAVAPGDAHGQLPGNQAGESPMRTVSELQEQWAALDKRWSDYLAGLTPTALNDTVYKCSSSKPTDRFSACRSDVFLHVFAHAQYTTAQVVNMLRQLGVQKLPATMVMAMVRQEASKSL